MAAEKQFITLNRELAREARPTPSALRLMLVFGGLLAAGFLFALAAGAPPGAAARVEPAGVYLEPANTPTARQLNVAPDRLATEGLIVVRSVAQLQTAVARQHPAAIWINEAALDQVPRDWLHAQFQQSVVIVGINMHDRARARHGGGCRSNLGLDVRLAASQRADPRNHVSGRLLVPEWRGPSLGVALARFPQRLI